MEAAGHVNAPAPTPDAGPGALTAEGLTKTFPGSVTAVQDASFTVRAGEAVALLGPNGAGKTTTLHMLVGLLRPSSGRALIAGVDVHSRPLDAYRRVGFVSEDVHPYGALTARRNLRFFGRVSGRRVPRSVEDALLERVGLAHAKDRPVHAFSKGMRQRLGLAIALVKDPVALVMDEPTTGLDPTGVDDLVALVRDLASEGKAVLFSTHDLTRVPEFADRLIVIADGRVQAELATRDVAEGDVRAVYRRVTRPGSGEP